MELDAFDEFQQVPHCGRHAFVESLGAAQLRREKPQEEPQFAREPRHQSVRLRLVVGPEARRDEAHAVAARLDRRGAHAQLVDELPAALGRLVRARPRDAQTHEPLARLACAHNRVACALQDLLEAVVRSLKCLAHWPQSTRPSSRQSGIVVRTNTIFRQINGSFARRRVRCCCCGYC